MYCTSVGILGVARAKTDISTAMQKKDQHRYRKKFKTYQIADLGGKNVV